MRFLFLLAAASAPVAAFGQSRAFELGAGFAQAEYIAYSGPEREITSATHFAVGAQSVDAAVYASSHVAFQLSVMATFDQIDAIGSASGNATASSSSVALLASVPLHVSDSWGRSGTYFAPELGLVHNRYLAGPSTSQVAFGLVIGHKFPIADVAAFRIEVNAMRVGSSSTDGIVTAPAYTGVSGTAGFSVFLR